VSIRAKNGIECGWAYGADCGGDEATPPAEDGEEANDEFDRGQDDGDEEGPVHPAGNLLIRVHALGKLVAKNLLHAGILETPYLDGVKVELEFARRALGDGFNALFVLCAFTVGPEANLVEVLEVAGGGAASECIEKVAVDVVDAGNLVDDGLRVGCEIAGVGLGSCELIAVVG